MRRLYVQLPADVANQLLVSARRHNISAAEEAVAILEDVLQPVKGADADAGAGHTERSKTNVLCLNLPEQLMSRLNSLAQSEYWSAAGAAAHVIEMVLERRRKGAEVAKVTKPRAACTSPRSQPRKN
jgi:hypothetical protein